MDNALRLQKIYPFGGDSIRNIDIPESELQKTRQALARGKLLQNQRGKTTTLISSSSKAYSQRIGALEKRFVDVAKSQAIILYECSFLLMPMVSVRVAGRFDLSPNIIAL